MPGTLAGRDLRADRHAFTLAQPRGRKSAFTLVEMLVSIVALTAFILIVNRLVNSASIVTTVGNKHMDADNQARSVLDRMAVDIAQMVKRSDVDYYLKNGAAPNSVGGAMSGGTTGVNDQIAFFSTVSGYPPTGAQSSISLVAYRVNSNSGSPNYNKLVRIGRGLTWNGVSSTDTPIVFFPLTIAAKWPAAVDPTTTDTGYEEVIGPQVFRFEYYYFLKSRIDPSSGATKPPNPLNNTPWDTTLSHTAVNGLQDISAIGVTIAIIDPQSRALVSEDSQHLGKLIGQMSDFSLTMHPSPTQAPCAFGTTAAQLGDLDAQWQCAVNTTTAVPRAAASAIHIYSRLFKIAN